MTCKWSMDEYTDWWAGCTEGFTGWSDKEPPRYCPECGERVEVEKRQLVYVHTCEAKLCCDGFYRCTECNHVMLPSSNYCSNCGAKVVGQ